MFFEFAGHFGRPTGARAIAQALCSLMGKALHPLSQGRIGKVEGSGDGFDVVARNHLTDGLRAAKDTPLLVCLRSVSGRHRLIGKVAMECDDLRLFQEWVLQWRGFGVTIEIVPVVSSKDTREVVAPYLDKL